MADPIVEKICPICGKDNNCMVQCEEPCWCLKIEIPQELINLIPADKKNKACICLKCIQDFKKDSKKFIKKM
ncbi:MAG: cysteine-rich CWC family protein [Candidatus Tenebribacter davisii]|jgi:hypothetical protein|nr:cysteine-rich CWC family protein [Candidatus Tenebribacter davisii]